MKDGQELLGNQIKLILVLEQRGYHAYSPEALISNGVTPA
jgi:hypothetical protein